MLRISRAVVDFSQDGYAADKLIDGKLDTAGWAVLPQIGKNHYAVFELKEPLQATADTVVRFQRSVQSQFGERFLWNWRAAVTTQPASRMLSSNLP